jgi:RES domain-containing protein
VQVWRLAHLVNAALDGEGARRNGGRWNSRGKSVVYTSSRLSLSVLELLAHVDPDEIPDDLRAFEIQIPDTLPIAQVEIADLPSDWQTPEHPACKKIGDDWLLRETTPILRVPSAIIPDEPNFLINPRHAASSAVAIVASRRFVFDPRLLR